MHETSANITVLRNSGGEYSSRLYECIFTKREGVGCATAEMLASNKENLPDPLDILIIREGLEELWIGLVEDKPEISETGEVAITAIGPNVLLKYSHVRKLWSDSGYKHWDVKTPVPPDVDWQWDILNRDNNHRVFLGAPKDVELDPKVFSGMYYRLGNVDKIDQALHSISYEYEAGTLFDGTKSIFNISTWEQDLDQQTTVDTVIDAGPIWKTLASHTFASDQKGITVCLDGSVTTTGPSSANWFKLTSVRVNGDSNFTGDYTYKEIIDDLITNHTTGVSTDFSDIAEGVVNIDTFYAEEDTLVADLITMAASGEDVSMGFYGRDSSNLPMLKSEAVNRTSVDWYGTRDQIQLNLSGPSVKDMYNKVRVVYDRRDYEGKRYDDWDVSDFSITDPAPLANAGITKMATIEVPTNSYSRARNSAKAFLTDHTRQKSEGGDAVAFKDMVNTSRGMVSPISMNPNEIIQFTDLDPSPETLTDLASTTNILNGRNIFRIVEVRVDLIRKTATVTFDGEGNRLDQFIADQDILER